jgi:hypothetical protein
MHKSIFAFRNNYAVPATYTYCRMIISYLKKIGFNPETDEVIIAQDYGKSWRKTIDPCLPQDTEVLTERGWKLLKNIVENKEKIKIATLNKNTNQVEYCYPKKYYKYYHKGQMIKFGGKSSRALFDIIMTPKHNQLFLYKHNKKSYIQIAEKLPTYPILFNRKFDYDKSTNNDIYIIPSYCSKTEWNNKKWRNAKVTTIVEYNERKFNFKQFLKLLGWYLAEGCIGGRIRKKKTIEKITIGQSEKHNPRNVLEIRRLLKQNKLVWSEQKRKDGMISFAIQDTQLATYLSKFGKSKEKYIPRDILENINKNEAKILLRALLKGDGHKRGKNKYTYTTVSNQLADDVQELAFKAGFAATKSKWYKGENSLFCYVYINKLFYRETRKKTIDKWIGNTYDIEIKNNLFFIRRNGKCLWTGNCYKSQRKGKREEIESPEWWAEMYGEFNIFIPKLEIALPFHFLKEYNIEADDWASAVCRYYKDKEIILVSSDKDWEMLCYFGNVKIFSPYSKKYKIVTDPMKVLLEKIQGDISDNLLKKPSSELEFERRKQIVNLIELPQHIEIQLREHLDKITPKKLCLGKIPFRSIREFVSKLYHSEGDNDD